MLIGIYCIKNMKNNKVYIGQSADIERTFCISQMDVTS